MNPATITASAEMRNSVFVAGIPPRRYAYGPTQADFACGATSIIACPIGPLSATNPAHKTLCWTEERPREGGFLCCNRRKVPFSSSIRVVA